MKKMTKSFPCSLMVAKLGGEHAFALALANNEIAEVTAPQGVRTPYFAFHQFALSQEKQAASTSLALKLLRWRRQ